MASKAKGKKIKKLVFTLFATLILYSFVTTDLIDVYKKGEITVIPDPEFGTNTNWDLLFRNVDQRLAFLPDGCFFRSASRNHKIYKFNEKGDLILEFGQHGQGPGDLTNPSDLSILDGKYLVVKEYSMSRRISIFDLDGNFVKLLKINYHASSCTSLKDNKIAIVAGSYGPGNKKTTKAKVNNVLIKDISTGKEVNVATFNQEMRESKLTPVDFYGSVNICRIDTNKLLVAFSENQEICIYSLNGEKISSFKVHLQREEVKNKDIDLCLEKTIENSKTEREKEMMRQWIKMNRNKIFFPNLFPYYYKITVDSEDNILVFLNNWIDNSNVTFQVYSKDGQYICTTRVNSGNFKDIYPTIFHENSFYTRLERKESDSFAFLARIKLY